MSVIFAVAKYCVTNVHIRKMVSLRTICVRVVLRLQYFFQTEKIKTFQTASINFDIPVPCTSEREFQEKGPKTQIFVHHTVDASGKSRGKGSDETEPP